MEFWDAHSHLAEPRLDACRETFLKAAGEKGIKGWIQGGIEPGDWERQRALKARYPGQILTAFGLHPWWLADADKVTVDSAWQKLTSEIASADALGETGLDQARDRKKRPSYAWQVEYFEKQLGLAQTAGKPLVLHIVQSHSDAIAILKNFGPFEKGGLVHSFSDSLETASRYIELGLLISVGADVTRPPPTKLLAALKAIPKESLVVETDCPDQSPFDGAKRRTGLNQPAFLLEMAEAVGRVRGEAAESVLQNSTANLRRVFKF
ncbi:MAG: TatD family hydrolase [Verrucomicrobiales bacterium]